MTSQKQIEANRRNAKKSTGPKTAAGKLNSSRNALKNGKYSKSQSPVEPTAEEMNSMWEELQRQARAEEAYFTCDPTTETERFVVTDLVEYERDGHTFVGTENSIWECVTTRRRIDRDKLREVREMHQRQYDEALAQLLALQAKRKAKANKVA